ncbi:DUF6758 family protein [Nocardioides sp. SYSU D00038]|uniref:DUF6758 family protein n=1 Tax=Nocardioides sp. SYSU D00038 TaxID=2812554 RepID=UPI001F074AA3|nr:DUF6758 family protein [Nocardioides sp. SYSU D00038]
MAEPRLLSEGCPRCPTPVGRVDDGAGRRSCPEHGLVNPLWRPVEASYDAFAEHLRVTAGFPTYLPWPLSPGWRVTDFAGVGRAGVGRAAMTCVSGTSELDGPVDVLVVSEEAGTGLGARCAGTRHVDPGVDVGDGRPTVRVRIDSQSVPLWPVSTSDCEGEWDRSVVAGEAGGCWLWLVLRPASAVLLLRDDWILRDVSGLGPPLVELPFGGPAPSW